MGERIVDMGERTVDIRVGDLAVASPMAGLRPYVVALLRVVLVQVACDSVSGLALFVNASRLARRIKPALPHSSTPLLGTLFRLVFATSLA